MKHLGVALVMGAVGLAGCDGATDFYETRVHTVLDGDTATTELRVEARWASGGHASDDRGPLSGRVLRAAPGDAALAALPETAPGLYVTQYDGLATSYRIEIEGDVYSHAAPRFFTAQAVMTSPSPRAAEITWDPPLLDRSGDEHVTVWLRGPAQPSSDCRANGVRATELDRFELPACAIDVPGVYEITVERATYHLSPSGEEGTHDYAYSTATHEVVRMLTLEIR